MKVRRFVLPALIALGAVSLRVCVFGPLDRMLPMDGLHVDEKTFASSPFSSESPGFSRPPGMFALSALLGSGDDPVRSRLAMSVLSLLPSAALYIAFRDRGRTGALLCSAGLALSPFIVLYGFQIMPAVPAAVLVSFSLLCCMRERYVTAGALAGIAVLFRAELVLTLPILLLFSFGGHLRRCILFTGSAAAAIMPVLLFNLLSGAGPVIAANGGQNLWLGTDWALLTTPPGVEAEELASTADSPLPGDRVFLQRAVRAIRSDLPEWLGMGARKAAAYFSLPGPGRNIETGWLLKGTGLLFLLPLTLAAMSLGTASAIGGGKDFWRAAASAVVLAGLASSFIFFPSARFRTAVMPAFWFLAAAAVIERRTLLRAAPAAALIIILSVLHVYPGMERPGLTSLLASEHFLSSGDGDGALEHLRIARERGYRGADLHNIFAVILAGSGEEAEALLQFEMAIEIAPGSPTLWRNYSVCLWSAGRYGESIAAADRAVRLNPLLIHELGPILEHGTHP